MYEMKNSSENQIYEVKLKGHLNKSWAEWFDGFDFTYESDGTTTLSGEIVDQAALHGLLKKIRDLHLPLISVNRLDTDESKDI